MASRNTEGPPLTMDKGAPRMGSGTASVLMIIARRERRLFQYVYRRFRHEPEVEVLFDRRLAERRRHQDPPAIERRHVERRRHDDRLDTQGWLVVHFLRRCVAAQGNVPVTGP